MAGAELRADADLALGHVHHPAHRRRRLGDQGRDATVEDAEGLVDLRAHGDGEHDALGGHLDGRDVELGMDAAGQLEVGGGEFAHGPEPTARRWVPR